jgi:type I restriction enzyme S subunit
MNKIEKLIEELCPEGVPLKQLGQVAVVSKGMQVNRETLDDINPFPVYNGGIYPSGRHTESNFPAETITVSQGGASAGYVNFVMEPLWVGAHCYAVVPGPAVINRFLFFVIKTQQGNLQGKKYGAGIPALDKKTLSNLQVPVPPIVIQQEIVTILDKFIELEAKLEAELEARRKQYEQYRSKLLSTHLPADVEFKTLRELLGPITRGKRLTRANLAEVGSVPVFHGGLSPIGYHDKSNSPGETVMIINTGASSGSVGWSNAPFWCSDGCFALPHSKEFSSRYIYHYALLNEQFFMDKVRKAGIPTLASESVYSLPIPVLPMAQQLEIAGTLDAFLELTSNPSIGVPAEITSRRQQYEYYRNKLLTFKELKAS